MHAKDRSGCKLSSFCSFEPHWCLQNSTKNPRRALPRILRPVIFIGVVPTQISMVSPPDALGRAHHVDIGPKFVVENWRATISIKAEMILFFFLHASQLQADRDSPTSRCNQMLPFDRWKADISYLPPRVVLIIFAVPCVCKKTTWI